MKNKIIGLAAAVSAVFMGTGCDNAKYNNIAPHAFLNECVGSIGIAGSKVEYPADGKKLELTVVLNEPVSSDASFRLVFDESVLARYNKEQGTDYEFMPDTLYTFGPAVTVPAGKYTSEPVALNLLPCPETMKPGTYAVPVRLVPDSGSVAATEVTSCYVAAFEVPKVSVSLPLFNGKTGLADSGFGQTLNKFTIEARFQVSNTANRNRDVFSNSNSVLLRFEDPQNDQNGVKAHSWVQFQGDGWYFNPDKAYEPNKWQHIALTYDGTKAILYVNGAVAGQKDGTIDPSFAVIGWFGGDIKSGGGHGTDVDTWWAGCKIIPHEARIWSTVRSAAQITGNMKGVSAKSDGLVGYWSFEKDTCTQNEAGETVFADLTGNGHDLVTTRNFVWIEKIPLADAGVVWP